MKEKMITVLMKYLYILIYRKQKLKDNSIVNNFKLMNCWS